VNAYNDGGAIGTGHKVWLTWDNPPADTRTGLPNEYRHSISGNIIEFFNASSTITSASLPIFKVHVGPSQNAFPVPTAWLPQLGYTQGGDFISKPTSVVVRIRSVRYGEKVFENGAFVPEKSTFVNFDRTPYKQALPAVWMDTLSAKLDFNKITVANVGVPVESAYAGFAQGMSGITFGTDLVSTNITVTGGAGLALPAAVAAASLGTAVLSGVPAGINGSPAANALGYSWAVTPGAAGLAVSGTSTTKSPGPLPISAAVLGGANTLAPTLSISAADLRIAIGGDSVTEAEDGATLIITIPLTLTLTYRGTQGNLAPRTTTLSTTVAYQFTGKDT
jgi:hypothetical protein